MTKIKISLPIIASAFLKNNLHAKDFAVLVLKRYVYRKKKKRGVGVGTGIITYLPTLSTLSKTLSSSSVPISYRLSIQSTYFRHFFGGGVNLVLRMPLPTDYTGGQDTNLSLDRVQRQVPSHTSALSKEQVLNRR